MKFSIGEKVVIGKDVIGTVEQVEERKFYYKDGRESSTYKYLVQYEEPWKKDWYAEDKIEHYLNDEISVNKVLINVNLLCNLPLAKQLKYENDQLEETKKRIQG
ncbi:hypothetical protein [Metabacillus arenae]|uniref:Uncharacterized protein n=1 Tax=Metabacillus arenae TaxID=2771434 RepID=A0A926NDD4_9BACI|nr:hypothetical protein [Metabacillus arenae]MBD1379075.1 hypothetical protein [Metabacillus arenae]